MAGRCQQMEAVRVWATLAVAVLGCFDVEDTVWRQKEPVDLESAAEVVRRMESNLSGDVDRGKRYHSRPKEHGWRRWADDSWWALQAYLSVPAKAVPVVAEARLRMLDARHLH